MQRCVQPSSDEGAYGTPCSSPDGAQFQSNSHHVAGPIPPASRCSLHRPLSGAAETTPPGPSPEPAGRPPDPGYPPRAPPRPGPDPGGQPAKPASVLSPSGRHRHLEAPFFCRLDREAIQKGGFRLFLATRCHPDLTTQGVMNPLLDAIPPPSPKIVINRLPGWEVVGEHSPRAAARRTSKRAFRISQLGMHPRPSPLGGGLGQERLKDPPPRIRKIRGIGFACPLGHHTRKFIGCLRFSQIFRHSLKKP